MFIGNQSHRVNGGDLDIGSQYPCQSGS